MGILNASTGGRALALVALLALCVATPVAAAAATPAHPFATAVYPAPEASSDEDLVYARVRDAGAQYVRMVMLWSQVAPTRPDDPADPNDPAYRWSSFDADVRSAVAHGLQPMVTLLEAPAWAETPGPAMLYPGTSDPDPTAFAAFAHAAALHYGGGVRGVPRVTYWQVWNEPNISLGFVPQFELGLPHSPAWYRQMVNGMAAAVHAVHADNVVIAGDTAPFRDITAPVVALDPDWGPLSFMRELLCLSPSLTPTCDARVSFDVWSHHPYTSGGPEHHAVLPNDVSLGDLPKMRQVLDAAVAAGHVVSARPVGFWVTEFSWDSDPPDPRGVPQALEARWVAEMLHEAWVDGIGVVTWFTLRDQPYGVTDYQSGLYERGATIADDTAKPALQAFRFPFVAYASGSRARVWGRSPRGVSGRARIEELVGGRWTVLGTAGPDRYGVFRATVRLRGGGDLRAEVGPARSRAFSLTPTPDQPFVPFGLATPLEPAAP